MLSEQLEKVKIVPVLVLNTLDEGLAVCEQLCRNGLPAAEITFRTAAAESVIREAVKRFPNMFIGAGTVLNIADLHRAFDAGAKFAVAPGFNPKVVAEAVKCGLDFFPAVCTPSEVEQAMEFGCRMLKFFPAEACGGVPMANVESYLQIPEVAAVGGTWLNKCEDETIRQAVAIASKYVRK